MVVEVKVGGDVGDGENSGGGEGDGWIRKEDSGGNWWL